MSERLEQLEEAVKKMHRCRDAEHIKSVPIREMFGFKIVWEGVVEVFRITDNPKAELCYAWSYPEAGETQFVSILGIPPIVSPETAVRAYIASLDRK